MQLKTKPFPRMAAVRVSYSMLALGFLLAMMACGGGSTSPTPAPAPSTTPTITSFSPASGAVASAVTVTGTNLTGATAVKFNGTSASSYAVNSATQITVTVPSGATTGKISVTTPNGTVSSVSNFTVTVPPSAPTITGFNPANGPVGTSVTITGTNLAGATSLKLNGTTATFTVNSATQITATVPSGATTGKFSVATPGGSANSANSFTVNTSSSTLDLSIDGLYVTQATQNYPNPIVPLVKDRSGWVRVFVKANIANTAAPLVQVQFINGSTINTLNINAPSTSVPLSIDPNTDASWDAAVPAAWIQPGVQVVATVDPSNAIAEADKTNNQFSSSPDVSPLHTWKVTLIPVHTNDGRTGVVESGSFTRNNWVDFAKRIHPVPDAVDVIVGSTLNSSVAGSATVPSLKSDGTNWGTVLNEISAKRSADGAAASGRYYFGVVKVSYSSGVAGLGFIGFPAAMGWDYTGSAPAVFAHEEGHNFNRPHSPCGGAGNPDLNYPYAGGLIGVPGWDAFAGTGNLKNESTFTDIMGYCSNQWISDYVYMSELNYRAGLSFDVASADVTSGSNPEGLLVWGRIENGRVTLEPAFKVPSSGVSPESGPYTWEARDALGKVLASVPFDAPEVEDLPNTSLRIFSFVVPLSTETMNTIQNVHLMKAGQELARTIAASQQLGARAQVPPQYLAGRRMQFSWDAAQSPVVMLRDAKTGEVRGFLRGGSATIEDVPDDLEVQFSDGIHSDTTRYQRSAP